MEYLITFNSTSQAIRAEKILLGNEMSIKIRPLPNEISSGCGISISFTEYDKVNEIVEKENINYDEMYQIENNVYKFIK